MKKSELLLGVNIDHVATLRPARGTRYPDPVHAALQVEQAGADSLRVGKKACPPHNFKTLVRETRERRK